MSGELADLAATAEGEVDPRWVVRCRRAAAAASGLVIAIGAVVLLGWILDVQALKSVRPSFVTMKVNTALLLILLGSGLLLRRGDAHPRLQRLLGAVIVAVAGATLAEYALGTNLGLDELLARDATAHVYPGRMSPVTTITFVLLGSALVLPGRGRPLRVAQAASLLTAAGSLVGLLGYLYGVGSLYAIGPYSATAVHTAAAELLASLAVLLARPDEGLLRLATSGTIAGQLLRRLLPVIVLAPIVLGWLRLEGQSRGLYQTPFGTALMVLSNVLLLTTSSWRIVSSLERSERKLRNAVREIGHLNATLEHRVLERTREVELARERLDGLISLAADAIISIDQDERITIFNKAAEEIFRREPGEVIGRPLEILLPERFRPGHHGHIAHFAAEPAAARPMTIRRRIFGLRKDGTEFPAEASISKQRQGEGFAFTVILRDISDRVRKEDERKVLVALLENSSDFIGLADPTGKPIYLNPAGRRMVGLPADLQIETTQIPEYYPPEQRAFATDVILRSMLAKGRWSGETYFRHWQTGESIPVSDEHFMIRDPETGRTLGMGTVTRDISQARRASDQLRESEERFRLTFDDAPIGMALVGLDGRFARVNRALCDIVGYSPDELARLTFHDITHPDDLEADVALAGQLTRGEIPRYQLEKRYIRKDGSPVEILLHGSILRSLDGAPLYYIAQVADITVRKRAEEERAKTLREKEILLKEIHHRVKNNLQMLSSLFYLQRERTDQESLRTLLDESRNRIQSIALIHEKLYESEHLAWIDFGEYLSDLTSRLTSAIGAPSRQARIRIRAEKVFLDIDRAIPCALIVNELVSNALKHAFPDGRAGEIDVDVGWAAPGLLRLAVSDTGVGFPEDLDFRNTRTLGMQLVCSLTTQLRGTVSLSRDGGTRFEILFAVAPQPGASPP